MEKILFITGRVPFPIKKGDQLRSYFQIKGITKSTEVHLFCISDGKHTAADIDHLNQFCKSITVYTIPKIKRYLSILATLFTRYPLQTGYFYSGKVDRRMKKKLKQISPDLIYFQLLRSARYFKNETYIKKIDLMDAYGWGMNKREEYETNWFKRRLFRFEKKRLLNFEKEIIKKYDGSCLISKQDRSHIQSELNSQIAIVKNGVDFEQFHPHKKFEKTYDLLFMGNMDYAPNIAAAKYIVNEILPAVWKINSKVTFHIAGANCDKELKENGDPRISIKEDYLDISDSIALSNIMLAPMIISIGLQNKVIQAMAMKVPCIVSKSCNSAIEATNEKEVLECESKEDYVNAILTLLKSKNRSNQLSENAYSFVHEHYSWEHQNELLTNFLTA